MLLSTYTSDVRLIALQNYFMKIILNEIVLNVYACAQEKKHYCMIRLMCFQYSQTLRSAVRTQGAALQRRRNQYGVFILDFVIIKNQYFILDHPVF